MQTANASINGGGGGESPVLGRDAVDSSAMEQRRIGLGRERGNFRVGEVKKDVGERVWFGGNRMSLKTETMAGAQWRIRK